VSVPTVDVDLSCFSGKYVDNCDRVFLHPDPRYTWDEIVPRAVAQNTFRGFHRIDTVRSGAKEGFVNYFQEEKWALLDALLTVRSRDDLNSLSNRICMDVRARLGNCKTLQLQPYNKIRKPIDLYLEHLVAMAVELDKVRATLVPDLFLPLDSWILKNPALFSDRELATNGLRRSSTYSDITSERTYSVLQSLLVQKAQAVAAKRGQSFHPIYFDLVWQDRYKRPGNNLFETNP
jgi:hypothetical protein